MPDPVRFDSLDRDVPAWEAFLDSEPTGQFQQSSRWATAKAEDGWSSTGLTARLAGRIVGGAQVLVKRTRFGRVAFVNKGPVVSNGCQEVQDRLGRELAALQKRHRWRALIVHPPDRGVHPPSGWGLLGFRPAPWLSLIQTTLVIDLQHGWEAIHARFRRTTRRNLRQANERGAILLEGGAGDLGRFFQLMQQTCLRQKTHPNPATRAALEALWTAFEEGNRARLFLVRLGERIVAGGLCLAFGDRFTFWKKGWAETDDPAHVNTLLTGGIIHRATDARFRWLDFVAVDPAIADALIAGRPLPEEVSQRRDFFNLGFGGEAWRLPVPWIRFRPVLAGRLLDRILNGPFRGLMRRRAEKRP